MQKKSLFLLLLSSVVGMTACQREKQVPPKSQIEQREQLKMTVLGEIRKNPFTIENMRKALANLQARNANAKVTDVTTMDIVPTHYYYRFKPANVDQLMDLEQAGFDLWDFRLDADVEDLGDYYHDPSVPENEITWMYTCIPVGVPVPTNIQKEKLADLFLVSDDSGDENDPEWNPEPPPCPHHPPHYICPDPYSRTTTSTRQIASATTQLKAVGVTSADLYKEAMLISGNEDEIFGQVNGRQAPESAMEGARRFRPWGRITVTDTDNPQTPTVGVQGLLVKTRRWFKLDHTYTDADGNFTIGKGYRRKVVVIAKFKNNNVTVRGLTPNIISILKPWDMAFPVKKNIGKFTQSEMEGLTYNFQYDANRKSAAARCFASATTLNAVAEMRQLCTQFGLPQQPAQLTIFLSDKFAGGGTALMARQIHGNLLPSGSDAAVVVENDILNLFTNAFHKGIVTQIMARNAPDITIPYGMRSDYESTSSTAELSNTLFHELSHALHMSQVGGTYWKDRVHNAYAGNFIAHGDAYGIKQNTRSGIVAVVESWGYYVGNTFNNQKYLISNPALATNELAQLENQRPVADPGDNFRDWIPYGLLHDMTDNGEPATTGVTDQVTGYTIQQLFSGFRPNVLSVQGLKGEILTRNNNQQATQVNTLTTSYFW